MFSTLRIVVGGVLFSVALLSVGLYLNSVIDQSFLRELRADRGNDTLLAAFDVGDRLTSLATVVNAATVHLEEYVLEDGDTGLKGESRFFSSLAAQIRNLRTLILMDSQGVIIDDTREGKPGIGVDVSDRDYFHIHSSGSDRGLVMVRPVVSRVDGEWTWVMSSAIRDVDGRLAGVVAASVDRRYFADLFAGRETDADLTWMMVHDDGAVLEASGQALSLVGDTFDWSSLVKPSDGQVTVSENRPVPWSEGTEVLFHAKVERWPAHIVLAMNPRFAAVRMESRYVSPIVWVTGLVGLALIATILLALESRRTQRARREAEEAREQAVASSEAKSRFLASMSHELRTPLNAVLGFTQLLQIDGRTPLTPEQHGYTENILTSGNHLLALVDDLLDLAKIEAGTAGFTVQEVNAAEVVGDCVALASPMADEMQVSIIDHGGDGHVTFVKADRERLRQVIMNLLSNAIKFNRERGTVTIQRKVIDAETVRVTVTDTGIGISLDDRAKIFELFHRGEMDPTLARDGPGIGLSVCKLVIEALSGRIGCDSEVGVGSTFWIELPIARLGPEAAHAERSYAMSTRLHTTIELAE